MTQVRPAKRPVEEVMLVVPDVAPLGRGRRGRRRRRRRRRRGGGGVMAAGGGGAVSNARRRRRRDESENPLGVKTNGAGATAPPQPASPDGRHGAWLCPAVSETTTMAASAGGPARHV